MSFKIFDKIVFLGFHSLSLNFKVVSASILWGCLYVYRIYLSFWGAGVVIRIVERKTIMRLIEEAVAAAGESVAAVGAAAVVAAEES